MAENAESTPRRPVFPWERVAAAGLFLEALGVLAWGTATVSLSAAGEVEHGDTAGFLVAFAAAVAIGLGIVARGLWSGARWSRSPAIVWQVLQIGIGLANVLINPLLGLALAGVGGAVLAGVFVAVRRAAAD